jgi:FKBP-type peptidyl-prolyl cis-trans isomerase FkpA
MARKRDRAFAGFGAALFLITSSALTIGVIVTLVTSSNSNSSSSSAASSSASTTKDADLAGTKFPGFTPLTTPLTSLQTKDLKIGTGATVTASDTITADYTGALASTGVIFDASADHGGAQTFPLKEVIAGWTQGIPGMKVGGTRELLIPAALGYGAQGSGSTIPPNSDLVFTVTITKIDKSS